MKNKTKIFIGILGALIVLISFVGKEVFVDRYKDELSDLSASKNLLKTRTDVATAQEATQHILNERARNQLDPGSLTAAEDAKRTERETVDQNTEYDRQLNTILEVVKDALKGDTHQQALLNRQGDLQQATNAAMNALLEADISWRRAFRRDENTLPFGQAISNAQSEFTRLDLETRKLLTDTQETIEKQESEIRKKLNFWKITVWCVFAVGWLLNLAGIVWKIDGLPSTA